MPDPTPDTQRPPDITGSITAQVTPPANPTPADPTAPTNVTYQAQMQPGQGDPNALPTNAAHTTTVKFQPQEDQPEHQQAPPAPQITPDQAHDQLVGRAAKAVLGALTPQPKTVMQVDPKTGQTSSAQVPNNRGAFWRNLIAGAMLGGAAAQDEVHTGSMLGGGVAGFRASYGAQEAQKQAQAQQAAQQQKLAMEQQKQNSEMSTADVNRLHTKAMVAQLNQQTLKENQQMQGMSLDEHIKAAKAGEQSLQDFANNPDIKPVAQNVTESDMSGFIQSHPGASTYLWAPTGVTPHTTVDPETGRKVNDYQFEYTAYDPQQPVSVSATTLQRWKDAGVDTGPLKPGQTLTATQYMGAFSQYRKNQVIKDAQDKTDLTKQEGQAKINKDNLDSQAKLMEGQAKLNESGAKVKESNAKATELYAQAGKIKQQIGQAAQDANQGKVMTNAYQKLENAGFDAAKIAPSDKAALGSMAAGRMIELDNQMSQLADKAKTDPAAKQQYMDLAKEKDAFHQLSKYAVIGNGGLDPDLSTVALALSQGKVKAEDISGRYMGKEKGKILAAAYNLNPDFRNAANVRQAFTNPDHKQAQLLQSVNKIAEHIGRLEENNDALGFAPLYGSGHDVTGPAKDAAIDVQAIAEETSKLMSGGVATEGQVKAWNTELRSSMPNIRKKAVDEISKVVGAQYKAMNTTFKRGTGETLPSDMVTPVAQDWLQKKGISISGTDGQQTQGGQSQQTKQTSSKPAAAPAQNVMSATGPGGHKIISKDGGNSWIDPATGKPIQ